ncbi:hypothetical protein J6590_087866 [Homalodisca vitripennis]|nr:hypothetical protein J6590_087866 [Homalodisca vitripennis]
MVKATKEAVAENCEETKTDLLVCLEESWQRRDNKSLNGFVSVTSFDTAVIGRGKGGNMSPVGIMSPQYIWSYSARNLVGIDGNTVLSSCLGR